MHGKCIVSVVFVYNIQLLPLGSVQRIISNMLPTSDVECTNTKNENSEMNSRKFWQFPSQKPLAAWAFSKKSGAENWKRWSIISWCRFVLFSDERTYLEECIRSLRIEFFHCRCGHFGSQPGTKRNRWGHWSRKPARIYFCHIHTSYCTINSWLANSCGKWK